MRNLKRFWFSKEDFWVTLRALFWMLLFAVCHLGYLASADMSVWHKVWSVGRIACLVFVLFTCRHFLTGEQGAIRRAGRRLKAAFGGFALRLFTWFSGLKGKRNRSGVRLKTGGYTDEVHRLKRSGRKRTEQRFRYRQWSRLTDAERVRYLYEKQVWKWKKADVEVKESNTPAEQLFAARQKHEAGNDSEAVVQGYNWVRYQTELPENFAESLGFLKKFEKKE